MSEVKVFRVIGEIKKPNYQTGFRKEVRAIKPEDAVETVYTDIGSNVEEVLPEEIENFNIRKLTLGEKERVK
jgi:large subunit ribosomal protein LX